MLHRMPVFAFCVLLVAAPAPAATIGHIVRYEGLTAAEIAKAPADQRAVWQAYVARSVAAYQADRAALAAERKGLAAVPPPVGDSFHDHSMPLDRPASWYGSAEARHIADVIVSFQTPAGGWGKNQDFTKAPRLPGQMYVPSEEAATTHPEDFGKTNPDHWYFVGTIDNDATTTQLRFLAKAIAQAGSADTSAWRASFIKGINYLLAAEFPSGGWPQVWPLQGGYHDALTYNDNAFVNTVTLLAQTAANAENLYAFVPTEVRLKAAASVRRAEKVLLATQVKIGGKRTVWGQQYNPITLEPEAARNFEPAALSATESSALLLFLMSDPEPSADEVVAVHEGIAWLKSVAIPGKAWKSTSTGRALVDEPGTTSWARFYDTTTMKPVFGDRDQSIHDDVKDIDPERRDGYSWYNTGPAKALKKYETWSKKYPAK